MQTHNLGYPRIGSQRTLKKACERYWSGKSTVTELVNTGKEIRKTHWQEQRQAGIDWVPSNDFSYYDQVLDMSLSLGAIPKRYNPVILLEKNSELDLMFAMARGYQQDGLDITAMEMTKWFDTNYHYIVPEFYADQQFRLFSNPALEHFLEAKRLGIQTKPVLIGPLSYLMLGKEKSPRLHKLDLIDALLPAYIELLKSLQTHGAEWVQLDEPFLALELQEKEQALYQQVYKQLRKAVPGLKLLMATYFEGLNEQTELAVNLPVDALHIDIIRAPEQLSDVLTKFPEDKILSLGLVDGRNIWKNNYQIAVLQIDQAIEALGSERVWIAPSCSLLHVPCDLELETNEAVLKPEIKQWMAFARQKLDEVVVLKKLSTTSPSKEVLQAFEERNQLLQDKKASPLIHNPQVRARTSALQAGDARRAHDFKVRKAIQQASLNLPLFPTTTIGSFPQTKSLRVLRANFKRGTLSGADYKQALEEATLDCLEKQKSIGLDVLVHGEFERNDMVEYFGEQLEGYAFTQNGWVQSYGSRCVKPPVIYGDVSRPKAMTVAWTRFAQAHSDRHVKGMLTGPVTMLQWSFVRDDQARKDTCYQIALALRDEVQDLEAAGTRIIQIDEPALREGLPLNPKQHQHYLQWAVEAFKLASCGVSDQTQIHTHMCYSEFNDIMPAIAALDADVITIECSRSQMELLDAFADFKYPNEIGPGVYDIHAPRVPSVNEMLHLLEKAIAYIPAEQLWVNPDCGLKTRGWEETEAALKAMVEAAGLARKQLSGRKTG